MKFYAVDIGEDTFTVLSHTENRGEAIEEAVAAYKKRKFLPSSYDVIRLYRGCREVKLPIKLGGA